MFLCLVKLLESLYTEDPESVAEHETWKTRVRDLPFPRFLKIFLYYKPIKIKFTYAEATWVRI